MAAKANPPEVDPQVAEKANPITSLPLTKNVSALD